MKSLADYLSMTEEQVREDNNACKHFYELKEKARKDAGGLEKLSEGFFDNFMIGISHRIPVFLKYDLDLRNEDELQIALIRTKQYDKDHPEYRPTEREVKPVVEKPKPVPLLTFPDWYKTDKVKNIVSLLKPLVESNAEFHYLFIGNTGSGKTELARIAMNCTLNQYDFVVTMNLYSEYLYEIGANETDKASNIYNLEHCLYRNCLIDDLGKEPKTEACLQFMESLLYRHHRAIEQGKCRQSIITTNLDLNHLQERYGDRIMDRIREKYTPVVFANASFRRDRYQQPIKA